MTEIDTNELLDILSDSTKMKDLLTHRIGILEKAIQDSIQNHNGLLGRLVEAKELLAHLLMPPVESVVDASDIPADVVVPENVDEAPSI